MSFTLFAILWLAFHLVMSALSGLLAHRWGREPFGWMLVGAVLGPFGLAALLGARFDDQRRQRPTLRDGKGATSEAGSRRVLVPIDGSVASSKAVEYVIKHLGADVQGVTVASVLPIETANGVAAPSESLRKQRLDEEIDSHLGSACESLRTVGISCDTVIRFGDPASEILQLAKEGDYEFIVMGRRGIGGAAKLLLGSVSDKVVKQAPCPVTVVD